MYYRRKKSPGGFGTELALGRVGGDKARLNGYDYLTPEDLAALARVDLFFKK